MAENDRHLERVMEVSAVRRRTMQAVKSENTAPERAVRSLVHRMGLRFRLHRKDLPGKPDLVFPRFRKVIFVHGCFWHGHTCARGGRPPKANADYWKSKISRNMARDIANAAALRGQGWSACVIWECELKRPGEIERRLASFFR